MGCGSSSINESPNSVNANNPEKEKEEENKIEKLKDEINFYRYGTINPNYSTYYEIIKKDFISIEEIEKYLKEKKKEEKDQYSDIYYLFLLYCWLSKNITINKEKPEEEQKCENFEKIISLKKTNSFGLATLFKSVGEKLGFKIEIIQGFTKHFGFELEDFPKQYETNHSYNVIIFKNLVLFCDIWLSIKDVENYDEPKTINRYYFCVPQKEIINFNFPLEEKWQEKENVITFDDFRNQIRLYSAFFKIHLEKISIFNKNTLEVEISEDTPPIWSLIFEEEIDNNISLKYYQMVDVFRKINDPYKSAYKGNERVFFLTKKKRGLFKYEFEKFDIKIADGFIRDVTPYKLTQITIGQRTFTLSEFRKYPVCLIPFVFGDLIKGINPAHSVVTLDNKIVYRFLLYQPDQKVAAEVKCGDIKAEVNGYYEYYDHKQYFLEIKFNHFGFYNCIVWVEDKAQIFFNILYAERTPIKSDEGL